MIRAALPMALLALATPATASEPLVHVPFVGCPSDGQTGPIPAPRAHRTPTIPGRAAAKLAYYATDYASVLAPRGWHCIGLYGSSSQFVIVTPERHSAEDILDGASIRGPAVQATTSVGGTSGRFSVAPAIRRYFPKYDRAYRSYLREMKEDDPEFKPPPRRPYKADMIRRRTADYLRFTTPAGKTGEGTNSRLQPGDLPIEGILKIVGSTEEPDLFAAQARLPPSQRDLIEVILADSAK